MSDIGKLEERFMKKKEQLLKLQREVQELEKRIQEEKEAGIIKAIRKISLTPAQYKRLEKSVNSGIVLQFLEELEKKKMEGEEE